MKGVILAAGKGTRMQPLTATRPKPLIPVANKPILEHIIVAFKEAGITELILVVSSSDKIKKYFGNGNELGVKISYVVQADRLGTAHAISKAEPHLKGDFIVAPGDDLIDSTSIQRLKEEHSGDITFCLSKRTKEELKHLGVVHVKGKTVQKIVEKPANPKGEYASTATFAFSTEIFKAIKKIKKTTRGEYELPDAINVLLKNGQSGWVEANIWQRLSYPWDILDANKIILQETTEERNGIIEDNVVLKGKVVIGEGTRIKSGTYIEGPVMIGKNCVIGPNCFIRNYVTLGDNVRVGNAVELKNTVIFNNTFVPHLSYLGDSIIGSHVNFGAGAVLTNLRFDDKKIKVNINGKLINTGRRKFGAIIGDDVKFGSHVVVNPGRKIGKGAFIHPGVVIYKDVKEGEEYLWQKEKKANS